MAWNLYLRDKTLKSTVVSGTTARIPRTQSLPPMYMPKSTP